MWDDDRARSLIGANTNWLYISSRLKLSPEFIREWQDYISWDLISQHQELSGNSIREFKSRVNWYWISRSQVLSTDLIREFRDRVCWYWISRNASLSWDSIREFYRELDLNAVRNLGIIDRDTIDSLIILKELYNVG